MVVENKKKHWESMRGRITYVGQHNLVKVDHNYAQGCRVQEGRHLHRERDGREI